MAKARKDDKGRVLRKGEIFRKKEGLYSYKYTDPSGKQKYLYSKDLAVLREKEDKLKRDQLDGLDVYVQGKATLNFVFDRYMKTKTELRKTTLSGYNYTYDRYVRDVFGKRKIADIKYSDVLFFYQSLAEEEELSISTIESVHTLLHPAFQLAVRDDIIRKNPSDGVLGDLKKKWGKTCGVRHALSIIQQEILCMLLQLPENLKWFPIVTVLLGTGCRIGEVVGLRWEDVDFENRVIDINHSISYLSGDGNGTPGEGEFIVSLPKTNAGRRLIPMLDSVYEALLEQKRITDAMGGTPELEVGGMTGFIFFNRAGNLYKCQNVNKALKRMIEDYNYSEELKACKEGRDPVLLPQFSCHHLRHTFCTRLCEVETNLKLIQNIMGHADIQTTMNIYADVMEETKKESFDNLSKKLDVFRKAS